MTAPCSCRVALHRLAVQLPTLQDRIDPAPCGFNFVAPHEQRLVAANHIHDEAFIGIRIALAEGFGKAHVQRHMAQAHAARTRILDHQPLLHALIGLEPDDELVGDHLAGAFAKDRMRDRLEGNDDFRNARGKPLAGAQVEGYASPAPVGDFGLQRHKGFGIAGVAFQIFQIAAHRPARRGTGAILAAHRHIFDIEIGNRLQGAQNLDLFVMDRIGFDR